MDFAQLIHDAHNKSRWVNWLSTDMGKTATETLSFLSACYSNIPQAKRSNIQKRLLRGDTGEIDAVIRELVTHELLRRSNLQPTWSPKIQNLNPDLMFVFNGKSFIADVFLVNSPKKTIHQRSDVFIEYWDKPQSASESRSKKIMESISEKSA